MWNSSTWNTEMRSLEKQTRSPAKPWALASSERPCLSIEKVKGNPWHQPLVFTCVCTLLHMCTRACEHEHTCKNEKLDKCDYISFEEEVPSNACPACSPVFLPVKQLNLTLFQLLFPMVVLANRGNWIHAQVWGMLCTSLCGIASLSPGARLSSAEWEPLASYRGVLGLFPAPQQQTMLQLIHQSHFWSEILYGSILVGLRFS